MQEIRLSASSISDFRACPMRYLYNYVFGLQPEKEKDSFRIGNIWHRCHEILEMIPQGKCPACLRREEIRANCYLCNGTGVLPADLMESVIRYLNYKYKTVPENKTYDDWQTERINILYSLSGYKWHYPDMANRFQSMAAETRFDLPVLNPGTNKRLGKAKIVGKIDEIIQDTETGLYYIRERKSTSQSLEGTTYWTKLQRDIQVTTYLYGARRSQMLGRLEKFGIMRDEPLIQGVWWDAWHKPSIAPKMLSQADSKEFVKTGEYFGEKFNIRKVNRAVRDGFVIDYEVNEVFVKSSPGKKEGTFSIFETPEMFGARLLSDIATRPDFYFQQREVSRTDEQLEQFEIELMKMVQLIRAVESKNLWYHNTRACESPFHCDFKDICYSGMELNEEDCPEGYKKYIREEKN